MPTYFIHLSVAKKVNPNAGLDFFIGNLAPDSVSGEDKAINHFRNKPDMELSLKKFAKTIDMTNDYLKGFLLHLFVDWKWDNSILADFAKIEGDGWYKKYYYEGGLIESYGHHNSKWAYNLREQMNSCDNFNYVEAGSVTKEGVKAMFRHSSSWKIENEDEPSTAFPPQLIERFATDTADSFIKWLSDLD